MAVSSVKLLLLWVLAFLPLLIRVGRGWKARSAPLKIAGDALPALCFPLLLVLLLVPLPGVVRIVVFAIAVLLVVWDVSNDIRSWRRSKAAAAPRDASPPSPRSAG